MDTRLMQSTSWPGDGDDRLVGRTLARIGRLATIITTLALTLSVVTATAPAAAKSKTSAPPEASAAPASSEPAHAISPWRGGPIPGGDARTAYCAVEAEFSNGITLSVARSGAGAVTMALLIPGLHAAGPSTWPVTLTLATPANPSLVTAVTASVVDAAKSATIVAVPLDTIPDPQSRLSAAETLTLDSAADRTIFQIPNGTGDAMTQLTACASAMR